MSGKGHRFVSLRRALGRLAIFLGISFGFWADSRAAGSSVVEAVAGEVVGQAHFKLAASLADAAVGVSPELGDAFKHVFHSGAPAAAGAVALLLRGGEGVISAATFVHVPNQAYPVEYLRHLGAHVGAVGPQYFAMVLGAHQLGHCLRVVHRRVCHMVGLDQLAGGVHFDVIFVPIVRLAALQRPPRVGVFLAPSVPVLIKVRRAFAALDLFVVGAWVALPGRFHTAGVDDLPPAAQALFEAPDGGVVGHVVVEVESQKSPEAQPVQNLHLGGLVAEAVEALQDQHLAHQHRAPRRTPAFALLTVAQMLQQGRNPSQLIRDSRSRPLWSPVAFSTMASNLSRSACGQFFLIGMEKV